MKENPLQAIQIQCISISQHCWNASSKYKVKKNDMFGWEN